MHNCRTYINVLFLVLVPVVMMVVMVRLYFANFLNFNLTLAYTSIS